MKLYEESDVLVSTGDLTFSDFAGIETIIPQKIGFGVYGNHDSGEYLEVLKSKNLHNQIYNWEGYSWGGFQGCPRYKTRGEFQFSEEEAHTWAQNFPKVDILVLHAGPKDILDDPSDDVHIGSIAVKEYVLQKQPKFVFCGHQYSNAELKIGNTMVFRTYGARIISI